VSRHVADHGGHREDDGQAGWSPVEQILGDHEHGPTPRLLVSSCGVEVGEKDVASAGALTGASVPLPAASASRRGGEARQRQGVGQRGVPLPTLRLDRFPRLRVGAERGVRALTCSRNRCRRRASTASSGERAWFALCPREHAEDPVRRVADPYGPVAHPVVRSVYEVIDELVNTPLASPAATGRRAGPRFKCFAPIS